MHNHDVKCSKDIGQLNVLIGFCLSLNLFLSIGIIGLNFFLIYYFLWKKSAESHIVAAGEKFSEAIKYAEFARIPPIGIAVIAELGGISSDDVARAYEKDSMERRAIVYSIMGRTRIANKFVDEFRPVFMAKGYDAEEAPPAPTSKEPSIINGLTASQIIAKDANANPSPAAVAAASTSSQMAKDAKPPPPADVPTASTTPSNDNVQQPAAPPPPPVAATPAASTTSATPNDNNAAPKSISYGNMK